MAGQVTKIDSLRAVKERFQGLEYAFTAGTGLWLHGLSDTFNDIDLNTSEDPRVVAARLPEHTKRESCGLIVLMYEELGIPVDVVLGDLGRSSLVSRGDEQYRVQTLHHMQAQYERLGRNDAVRLIKEHV